MADDDQDLTPDEGTEQIPERPAWLPSSFERPEDVAKAWENANKKITEMGQENAELRRQQEELQTYQEQVLSQQQQTQNQDYAAQLAERLETGDGMTMLETMAYLAQQAAEEKFKGYQPQQPQNAHDPEVTAMLARQELSAKYEDWAAIQPKIGELIQDDPGLFTATAATPLSDVVKQLDRVYRLARAETGWQERDAATTSLNETNRLIKNQAQTLSGQSLRQDPATMWDQIKDAKSGIPSFRIP